MAGFSDPVLCILVVDDDVETLRVYGLHLGRLGHTVHQAHSGAHALEQIAVLHPDLVFLDLGMPGMDGFEVANRIRSEPRLLATKVIAVTAYDDTAHRQRGIYTGFDGYLVKPVAFEAIEAMIDSVRNALLGSGQHTHPEC